MNKLSKDQARDETLRRWRALPAQERQSSDQAEIFAAALADELDFHTMGNARKIIFGWLTHELAGLPPWGNLLPESLVVQHKEAAMAKTKLDEQVEDGTFLAENFGVAPQNAAALVAGDDDAKAEVEDKLRKQQRSPDDATDDLIPDNDETRRKPVLRSANKRAGGG